MAAATPEQRERQAELQGLLCGVVQVRGPPRRAAGVRPSHRQWNICYQAQAKNK
jgi:hypothetical protein